MKNDTPKTIFLRDYTTPDFIISEVFLTFDLDDEKTRVTNSMKIQSQSEAPNLVLNGEELVFLSAKINGEDVDSSKLVFKDDTLTILDVPREFELTIENQINPSANKALDGLYKSGTIFCSQNEPEGFRRITYYIDRPDVMAKFKTKIIADKKKYPVMLSNGNPIESGDLEGGKHWIMWEDPFPKPCYLYALVAGDLGLVQDEFTTCSGRKIDLRIYVDKGNEDKCGHAMESLKNSMKWDEERFGLEYDLDIYMIVAVDAFNMGAMENKGLNIFNSAYVLAKPETATDANFMGIESVIGHEYFHNWTGNRITCRDWFQLTLKEGLTVFRDQEFSADLNSRTVQRIQDVERLRQFQFAEDTGPTAHPIKPDSYIEINNFYTVTIYEKGAEVIRMLHTLLGEAGFRKGMDKYFELYDGQAVTTEDFLHAMSVANNNIDLEQFKLWYSQAGTPQIDITTSYDESSKKFKLKLSQSCPKTPGQEVKKAFYIPLRVGLVGRSGDDLALQLSSEHSHEEQKYLKEKGVIILKDYDAEYTFVSVTERPVLSLNRGFSAPVKLKSYHTDEELLFLMANDKDEFNRYEAAQVLAFNHIQSFLDAKKSDGRSWDEMAQSFEDHAYLEAYHTMLLDKELDPSMKMMMLDLPSLSVLQQAQNPVNHCDVVDAKDTLTRILANRFEKEFLSLYRENHDVSFKMDGIAIGKRALKTLCLRFLAALGKDAYFDLALEQFDNATNMTDESSALNLVCAHANSHRDTVVERFFDKWKHETLVMQKWLMAQASSPLESTYENVLKLENSEVFDINIPNLVRSLVGSFARNMPQFHHKSGRGYEYVAKKVLTLDSLNPQVASGLVGAFRDYKRLEDGQRDLMKVQLEKIRDFDGLSKNTFEIVSKILNS